jgi:peptidoglycan-N-acetylglucosamine deacetylase
MSAAGPAALAGVLGCVLVLSSVAPGAIVLMHVGSAPDGSTLDADALPGVIAAIRARGYRLVELGAFVR